MSAPVVDIPSIEAIRANRARLADLVVTTSSRRLVSDELARRLTGSTSG
jgi:hypothetical protein